jgi:antitoxin component HigA of HigAB toxin-antitoxin module
MIELMHQPYLLKSNRMKKITSIKTDKDYHQMMIAVYELMNKGEAQLTTSEIEELQKMTLLAEKYENEVMGLKPVKQPKSLAEMIELFMFENKLTQAKLADKIGIGTSKLSQILTGKRQPDVSFLKAIYRNLHLDPKFILDHV